MQGRSRRVSGVGAIDDDVGVGVVVFVDLESSQEPVAASDGSLDGQPNSTTVEAGQRKLDRGEAQTLDLKNEHPVGHLATKN